MRDAVRDHVANQLPIDARPPQDLQGQHCQQLECDSVPGLHLLQAEPAPARRLRQSVSWWPRLSGNRYKGQVPDELAAPASIPCRVWLRRRDAARAPASPSTTIPNADERRRTWSCRAQVRSSLSRGLHHPGEPPATTHASQIAQPASSPRAARPAARRGVRRASRAPRRPSCVGRHRDPPARGQFTQCRRSAPSCTNAQSEFELYRATGRHAAHRGRGRDDTPQLSSRCPSQKKRSASCRSPGLEPRPAMRHADLPTTTRKMIKEINASLPPGTELQIVVDYSPVHRRRDRRCGYPPLEHRARPGGLVGRLFLFLGSWRAALHPAVVARVCIVSTFTVLAMFGLLESTCSALLALVLAIGLEDGRTTLIVVVENVQRHVDEARCRPRVRPPSAAQERRSVLRRDRDHALMLIAVFAPVDGACAELHRAPVHQELAVMAVAAAVFFSALMALGLLADARFEAPQTRHQRGFPLRAPSMR